MTKPKISNAKLQQLVNMDGQALVSKKAEFRFRMTPIDDEYNSSKAAEARAQQRAKEGSPEAMVANLKALQEAETVLASNRIDPEQRRIWEMDRDMLKNSLERGEESATWAIDFKLWLQGKGKAEDHYKTPWGRTPLYSLPGVLPFLTKTLTLQYKFKAQLMLLYLRQPQDLDTAYLYFKYIVRGDINNPDTLGYMKEWEILDDRSPDAPMKFGIPQESYEQLMNWWVHRESIPNTANENLFVERTKIQSDIAGYFSREEKAYGKDWRRYKEAQATRKRLIKDYVMTFGDDSAMEEFLQFTDAMELSMREHVAETMDGLRATKKEMEELSAQQDLHERKWKQMKKAYKSVDASAHMPSMLKEYKKTETLRMQVKMSSLRKKLEGLKLKLDNGDMTAEDKKRLDDELDAIIDRDSLIRKSIEYMADPKAAEMPEELMSAETQEKLAQVRTELAVLKQLDPETTATEILKNESELVDLVYKELASVDIRAAEEYKSSKIQSIVSRSVEANAKLETLRMKVEKEYIEDKLKQTKKKLKFWGTAADDVATDEDKKEKVSKLKKKEFKLMQKQILNKHLINEKKQSIRNEIMTAHSEVMLDPENLKKLLVVHKQRALNSDNIPEYSLDAPRIIESYHTHASIYRYLKDIQRLSDDTRVADIKKEHDDKVKALEDVANKAKTKFEQATELVKQEKDSDSELEALEQAQIAEMDYLRAAREHQSAVKHGNWTPNYNINDVIARHKAEQEAVKYRRAIKVNEEEIKTKKLSLDTAISDETRAHTQVEIRALEAQNELFKEAVRRAKVTGTTNNNNDGINPEFLRDLAEKSHEIEQRKIRENTMLNAVILLENDYNEKVRKEDAAKLAYDTFREEIVDFKNKLDKYVMITGLDPIVLATELNTLSDEIAAREQSDEYADIVAEYKKAFTERQNAERMLRAKKKQIAEYNMNAGQLQADVPEDKERDKKLMQAIKERDSDREATKVAKVVEKFRRRQAMLIGELVPLEMRVLRKQEIGATEDERAALKSEIEYYQNKLTDEVEKIDKVEEIIHHMQTDRGEEPTSENSVITGDKAILKEALQKINNISTELNRLMRAFTRKQIADGLALLARDAYDAHDEAEIEVHKRAMGLIDKYPEESPVAIREHARQELQREREETMRKLEEEKRSAAYLASIDSGMTGSDRGRKRTDDIENVDTRSNVMSRPNEEEDEEVARELEESSKKKRFSEQREDLSDLNSKEIAFLYELQGEANQRELEESNNNNNNNNIVSEFVDPNDNSAGTTIVSNISTSIGENVQKVARAKGYTTPPHLTKEEKVEQREAILNMEKLIKETAKTARKKKKNERAAKWRKEKAAQKRKEE